MPSCCVVPFCSSRDAGHRFPKDPELRKKWLVAIKRYNFEPTNYSRICKRHFVDSDFVMPLDSVREIPLPMLRKGASPSQFDWTNKLMKETDIKEERVVIKLEEDSNLKDSIVKDSQ